MRLSPSRVLLRAVLLVAGAAFMAWRAWEAHAGARAAAGTPEALLLGRVALVEALVAALALCAATLAALALRQRPRAHTLSLRDLPPPPPPGGAQPPR